MQANFREWLAQREIDIKNATYEAWMINFDYQGHEFGNIFLVGDAGGFASGLTGEGMYYAMVSGQEIAKKIINPKYDTPKISGILTRKVKHDKILKTINFDTTLSQIEYATLGLILKTHLLDRKIIDSFA